MTSPASSAGDVALPRRRRQAIWGREIPFRNPDFIGREEELEALHSFLGGKSSSMALIGHPIEAVHGLGGVGKTELAAEYAHRYRDEYDLVWWIRAEQDYAIGAALIGLGTRLGLANFQP